MKKLPIYRDMLRLTALLMHDIKNMSKVMRHTLGDRMVSRALDALDNLSEGYLSKDVPSARLEAQVDAEIKRVEQIQQQQADNQQQKLL